MIDDRDQEKAFGREEKEEIITKKTKKKTRGTLNSQFSSKEPLAQPKKSNSLIHIESLTGNKSAWKTFYQLFSKYYPD